jgi:energy-coupling factor transporter ATP-binding protein EcfA2
MIEKITIERFKNIKKIELTLDNINVLVGANNSGKSSILQSIQFAVSIAQTTSLEEFRLAKWRLNKLSTSLTTNQIIYSPIRDIYSLGNGGALRENRDQGISVKFEARDTHDTATFLLRKGRNKNLLTEIEGETLGNQIRNLEDPFAIYVPGLAGIPAFEELKSEGIIRRAAAKGDANNVFRNILWLLKQDNEKWQNFLSDFNDVFPNLILEISFDRLKDEHINASILYEEKLLPIDAFGTGVLQTLQILSYVHLYNPKILILDEPDSHLHPSNQRIVAEKLREITNRLHFQIILSTHSRHLLDAFKEYSTVQWISNGAINKQEYNFISVLLDIGALDKGDILNDGSLKCVILTEDTKTEFLKTVLSANDFNIIETDIWSYDGCSRLDTAIVLAAFIKRKAPGTVVIIHRDSDYLTPEKMAEIKVEAEAANIKIFFTKGTDIESHFLDPSHINKVYYDVSLADINTLIEEATDEKQEKSIRNFINSATEDALKIQYAGGAKIDPGTISAACHEKYHADKGRYRHGKSVFKSLRNKIAAHGHRDLIIPTEDLKTEELVEIKDSIWE